MRLPAVLLASLLVVPALAGCLGGTDAQSEGPEAPPANRTVSELPETITSIEHEVRVSGVQTGAGVFVHGDHAYVSGLDSGFYVVDVSDPTRPRVESRMTGIYARDIDIVEYGDHRHAAVLAAQDPGFHVIDVTDPTDPEPLVRGYMPDGQESHNVGVLPDSTLVYNSVGDGRGGEVQIVDLSDPADPKLVSTFGRSGCHDLTFHLGDDKERLVCAGEAATELYDIEDDPTDPEYISEVRNPFISVVGFAGGDGGSLTPGLHHWSLLDPSGEILIIGDEFAGGLAPGCAGYAHNDGETFASPIGALWFYDVSDEESPELLGWFSPPAPVQNDESRSCTSHFGELIPGTRKLVIGWYAAGTILVDYSDPANPVMLDQWNDGTNTWDVRLKDGYLLTGDMARGTDVLELA